VALQINDFNYAAAINHICELVGFPKSADPAGSIDSKHGQMRAAINNALNELLIDHEWQDLITAGTISVLADSAGQREKSFALPADFYRFIDQTQWGGQTTLPAPGPTSPQAWKCYVVNGTTPLMTLTWQVRNDRLYILGPPYPTALDFEFFYMSRAQIIDQDDPTLLKNVPAKNGDTFILDPMMITLLARKKWLEMNGFDSSAATAEYNTVYNTRSGAEKGGPLLSLNQTAQIPLLSAYLNVPQTGFGS
jgi:hypothetical protein